jgi:acetate kinase
MSKSLKMNLMNITNLKLTLHALVERINDKDVLYYLQTDEFPYVIDNRTKKKDNEDVVEYFPEEEILKIRESIKRMEAGDRAEIKKIGDRLEECFPGFKERMTKCLKETEKKLKRKTKKELRKKLHLLIDNIKSKYTLNVLLIEVMPDFLNKKLQRDRKRVREELLL